MERFKINMLAIADILNAWRVIPRLMAGMYGYMVYKLYLWYTSIPTFDKKTCDDSILNTLINNGLDPSRAMEMACSVTDIVGGPTSQQTSFASIIIGLSSAIFAFYVGSGNKASFMKAEKVEKKGCDCSEKK